MQQKVVEQPMSAGTGMLAMIDASSYQNRGRGERKKGRIDRSYQNSGVHCTSRRLGRGVKGREDTLHGPEAIETKQACTRRDAANRDLGNPPVVCA